MDLKTRYQYTYFIHTFIVRKSRYSRYIARLLKDEKFKLKIFDKSKDLELYSYFLPKTREFLFKTFELNKEGLNKIEKMPFDTRVAVLAEYPSISFEYNLDEDMQGKTIDENSIFFKIQKVGVICFNTGICFLYFKTNIEESQKFADVLNFNYKFRDINQNENNLKDFENIKVQTNCFDDITQIKDFITNITGPNFDALKLNLDVERFYTYSYECIDQSAWNTENTFEDIKSEFLRYANILPNDKGMNIEEKQNIKIISNEKYSKIGITKLGMNLLCSDVDINNYTILPVEFENQYFYTYILAIYLKVYMKKINYDFENGKNLDKTRKEFVNFTKKLWIQEVSSNDMGSFIYQNIKEILEEDGLYNTIKNKYDILYKELDIEKDKRKTNWIILAIILTMIVNILNLYNTFK